jgi:phage gp29-like protein
MIYAEIFGMPVRIARYEPAASAEEKRELLHMLESLGSNAVGLFSRAVELQVIDANRGAAGAPYERLIDFLNREMSKAWLGQTLTTDITGQSGSIAASQVHNEVRREILADDIRKEARTIRRDLLAPITRLRFGAEVPVPYFVRTPRDSSPASR